MSVAMPGGTVVPAIADFLLTAVPNWCGTTLLRGAPIGGHVALWVAGRMAFASANLLYTGVVAHRGCPEPGLDGAGREIWSKLILSTPGSVLGIERAV
jgi:hypothetical protein